MAERSPDPLATIGELLNFQGTLLVEAWRLRQGVLAALGAIGDTLDQLAITYDRCAVTLGRGDPGVRLRERAVQVRVGVETVRRRQAAVSALLVDEDRPAA